MNINIDYPAVVEKAYNGITIKTDAGKELHICLRDYGWDVKVDNGEWFHIDSEEDVCCVKCKRKKKLNEINKI